MDGRTMSLRFSSKRWGTKSEIMLTDTQLYPLFGKRIPLKPICCSLFYGGGSGGWCGLVMRNPVFNVPYEVRQLPECIATHNG